jgi:uncharacterized membrane protein
MNDVIIARALHVLAVVIWIGGVAMATTVAIPAIRRGDLGENRLHAFEAFEGRFVWQARTAVIIVGLTGFYMVGRFNIWDRFHDLSFWWMHAMVCLWLIFVALLFVGEPLVLHRYFHRLASRTPDVAFARLQRLHWVLLILALITIFGAVAGVHGWSIF